MRELHGAVEGWFGELRASLEEDMRGLHIELIRELEAQRHEMREIVSEERREIGRLREENERLRQENLQLRAPLGGLVAPAAIELSRRK
jgi:regulator of replication initiation timing